MRNRTCNIDTTVAMIGRKISHSISFSVKSKRIGNENRDNDGDDEDDDGDDDGNGRAEKDRYHAASGSEESVSYRWTPSSGF